MISGVAHIEIAARIESESPGVAELARLSAGSTDDLGPAIVGIEHLGPAVTKLADKLITGGVDPDIVGIAHLTGILTRSSIGPQPFSGGGKNLDAMVT